MFDLEQHVDAWCRSAIKKNCHSDELATELKDHVYCYIDQYLDEGLSENQAFEAATQRLGKAKDLMAEFGKTQGLLATICEFEQSVLAEQSAAHSVRSPKKLALFTGLYLALFAIVNLTASHLLAGSANYESISAWLFFLWLIPLITFPGIYKTSKAEWACIKRFITTLRRV